MGLKALKIALAGVVRERGNKLADKEIFRANRDCLVHKGKEPLVYEVRSTTIPAHCNRWQDLRNEQLAATV